MYVPEEQVFDNAKKPEAVHCDIPGADYSH
jgi:hypothetical protein